jgi:hypothetical protein
MSAHEHGFFRGADRLRWVSMRIDSDGRVVAITVPMAVRMPRRGPRDVGSPDGPIAGRPDDAAAAA